MTRLIVHIGIGDGKAIPGVNAIDAFAAENGLAKRHAGYLPNGDPAGYIYCGPASMIRLLLLTMAQQPYVKVDHQWREVKASLVLQSALKRFLFDSFPERCSVIGDWGTGAETKDETTYT